MAKRIEDGLKRTAVATVTAAGMMGLGAIAPEASAAAPVASEAVSLPLSTIEADAAELAASHQRVATTAYRKWQGESDDLRYNPSHKLYLAGISEGWNLYSNPHLVGQPLLMIEYQSQADLAKNGIGTDKGLVHVEGTVSKVSIKGVKGNVISSFYELNATQVERLQPSK